MFLRCPHCGMIFPPVYSKTFIDFEPAARLTCDYCERVTVVKLAQIDERGYYVFDGGD